MQCKHYGALFIGRYAAEVLGDYGSGPNHVLPTGGTAKHSGGLSVHTFLRIRTWMSMDPPGHPPQSGGDVTGGDVQGYHLLVDDAVALARIEGLEAHARAAEIRKR
jgi:phosphoribosyl-ATP pyrophosphohydrolase/phosphoribosyl-AMP cyclohydrolase/histidinol dehydrogenase